MSSVGLVFLFIDLPKATDVFATNTMIRHVIKNVPTVLFKLAIQ